MLSRSRFFFVILLLSFIITGCKSIQQYDYSLNPLASIKHNKLVHLTVKTAPNARVRILNIRPKYTDNISLKKGKYHLEVSKPGYITIKKWISLQDDKTIHIPITKAEDHPSNKMKDSSRLTYQNSAERLPSKAPITKKTDRNISVTETPKPILTENETPNYQDASNEGVPYLCSFSCIGSMESPRGPRHSVETTAIDTNKARREVKQYTKTTCKKYPFYQTGGGKASVGDVICNKKNVQKLTTASIETSTNNKALSIKSPEISNSTIKTTSQEIPRHIKKKTKMPPKYRKTAASGNFKCSFLCVGSMDSPRGSLQNTSVTAINAAEAEQEVKQSTRTICKKYPFYEAGGGRASVKNLTCKKIVL